MHAKPSCVLFTVLMIASICFVGIGVAVAGDSKENGVAHRVEMLEHQLDQLQRRLSVQEDMAAIDRLTKAYGYYSSAQDWDSVIDLFADDCAVEIALRGVYLGKSGAETVFKKLFGLPNGITHGDLFNHMQLQGIVTVDPEGRTAKGRYFLFAQNALPMGGSRMQMWGFGIYENDYVKEKGVWKFKKMHWYTQVGTPYDQGWAKVSFPPSTVSSAYPPDLPPTVTYTGYPDMYVPPYSFPHPVTGE